MKNPGGLSDKADSISGKTDRRAKLLALI